MSALDKELLEELGINETQYAKLKKFRSSVMDILLPEHDDFYLVRWLKARQFDLAKAEDMIRKHVDWRRDFDVDNILTNWKCPEVLEKYNIGGHCGYDKGGHPVWIYALAHVDTKGLQLSATKRDHLKQYIYRKEISETLCKAQSQKLGRRIEKSSVIMDLEHFGLSRMFRPGVSTIFQSIRMAQDNYPESLLRTYIVNAPKFFPVLLNMVKPFLHEETRKRIVVLAGSYKERLLEDIDATELPIHWGGTKADPVNGDEYCSSIIPLGGEVPQEYYIKQPVEESKIKKVHVDARQVAEVECQVNKNVQLRYIFWTSNHDIKFKISRRTADNKREDVIGLDKYESSLVPQDGVINSGEEATYVFTFDNTYSWLHGKDVYYTIETQALDELSDGEEQGDERMNAEYSDNQLTNE